MRSSPSGTFKTKGAGPKSEKSLLLVALCIACACAASYVAGLHASKCKFTAVIHGTASPAHQRRQHILRSSTHASAATQAPHSNATSGAHAPRGRHILLEFYKIPGHLFAPLTDTDALQHTMSVLIQQAGMTYLGQSCHVFPGTSGVTCTFLLSESHISMHTWPEHHYAALDIFTCGKFARPEAVEQGLRELLQPGLVVRQELARGGMNMNMLTPEQRAAKVLHTFVTSSQDGESMQQLLYQVPILHSTASKYQSILIVEVPGQLGKCLLLDGTIQFCSHDLDAYTDHMARHPLQLLQAVRGCGLDNAERVVKQHTSSGYSGKRPTAAAAVAAANLELLVTPAALAPAASASKAGHVTCRKSMLQPPARLVQAAASGGAAGNASSADDMPACLGGSGQQKARVLLVGGGDGWIAGHLVSCYGDYVEHVTAVELDEMVSFVTEQHFRQIMHHGSPFKHPDITWEYTDAYAWALQKVAQCSSSIAQSETQASRSSSSSTSHNESPASAATGQPDTSSASSAAQAAAAAGRRLESEDASNLKIAVTRHNSRGGSSTSGSQPAVHCAGFDLVIIDSTDFTVTAASKLHSEAFYAALHQLMRPQAALIQIVEIYLRVFEKDFVAMEGALRRAGWKGVGRSSVFVPSYSGEALMLHAVKDSAERGI